MRFSMKWRKLKALQDSPIRYVIMTYPFIGYYIVFNDHISSTVNNFTKDISDNLTIPPNINLYCYYVAFLLMSIAFLIVKIFCHSHIKSFKDHVELTNYYKIMGSIAIISLVNDARKYAWQLTRGKYRKEYEDHSKFQNVPPGMDLATSNEFAHKKAIFYLAESVEDAGAYNFIFDKTKNGDPTYIGSYIDELDGKNNIARFSASFLFYVGASILIIVSSINIASILQVIARNLKVYLFDVLRASM